MVKRMNTALKLNQVLWILALSWYRFNSQATTIGEMEWSLKKLMNIVKIMLIEIVLLNLVWKSEEFSEPSKHYACVGTQLSTLLAAVSILCYRNYQNSVDNTVLTQWNLRLPLYELSLCRQGPIDTNTSMSIGRCRDSNEIIDMMLPTLPYKIPIEKHKNTCVGNYLSTLQRQCRPLVIDTALYVSIIQCQHSLIHALPAS